VFNALVSERFVGTRIKRWLHRSAGGFSPIRYPVCLDSLRRQIRLFYSVRYRFFCTYALFDYHHTLLLT